jgi:hypothetical protein
MTPAGKLQDRLKKLVQGSGGQYRKVRWEGRRGCPDCFIWWEWPNAAFVEIKAEGDRYSKLQEREVHRMQHDGIPVFTARDLTDIEAIVEIVRHGKR